MQCTIYINSSEKSSAGAVAKANSKRPKSLPKVHQKYVLKSVRSPPKVSRKSATSPSKVLQKPIQCTIYNITSSEKSPAGAVAKLIQRGPKVHQKSTKSPSKVRQKSTKSQPKVRQKSIKSLTKANAMYNIQHKFVRKITCRSCCKS